MFGLPVPMRRGHVVGIDGALNHLTGEFRNAVSLFTNNYCTEGGKHHSGTSEQRMADKLVAFVDHIPHLYENVPESAFDKQDVFLILEKRIVRHYRGTSPPFYTPSFFSSVSPLRESRRAVIVTHFVNTSDYYNSVEYVVADRAVSWRPIYYRDYHFPSSDNLFLHNSTRIYAAWQ